ncbi:hypothetical protein FRUB_09532 [Fimbriiglobus ruber]|uniref:Uncharacterized protein n=1 Tax=Fimbriiglobus ruber TaxID=1908690 RepID=A0A225CZ92_9BACT|nr:hypothetical protein FRUB_09532 [Fimbriiglobus ruber]
MRVFFQTGKTRGEEVLPKPTAIGNSKSFLRFSGGSYSCPAVGRRVTAAAGIANIIPGRRIDHSATRGVIVAECPNGNV